MKRAGRVIPETDETRPPLQSSLGLRQFRVFNVEDRMYRKLEVWGQLEHRALPLERPLRERGTRCFDPFAILSVRML